MSDRSLSDFANWPEMDGGYGVAIVAPYPSVRAGLRAMVEQISGVAVIAEAADDDLDPSRDPDTIIVDIEPEQTTIVQRLAEQFPNTAVLLLLDSPAMYQRLAITGGAVAALLKSAGGAEIAAALAGLAQGLIVLDPAIAWQAPAPISHSLAEGEEALTPREREVLELLAQGLPNKTIAMELGISEHTAKFHVGTIMSKLGAASRTEAVALAARSGLLVL
ncbi:MAG TPA: response regulator transcription factor [Thermomicrobiales bacterium]|nr:response regulator transcription factor [Thermomicrobiales bacterium]